MMRLMISVVSAMEARAALAGGAEILDVKNPAEGSLGAQSPSVIREIKDLVSNKAELSAAIGDMPNLPGTAALAALGAATCGADYIKVGLHGPHTASEAIALLHAVRQAVLEFKTSVIAAGYADFLRAGTLNPMSLPAIAASAGVRGFLLDTAIKDGQSLLAFMDLPTLRLLVEQAHRAGLFIGLAGALRAPDLTRLRDIGADVIGLRSAVCRNHQRNEPLDPECVRQLHHILVPVV
jgi:(5-formylfuran-3-yl)methyl phosphate synthase